jgi:NADH-quinone oxidoreductase subunit A
MPDLREIIFYDYFPLFIFICLSFAIAIILIVASLIIGVQLVDPEKISAYECGFNPFDDARTPFDIKFYLVAIIFIIFDVEIALLIPLVYGLFFMSIYNLVALLIFLFLLALGFVYEWQKGVLDWS